MASKFEWWKSPHNKLWYWHLKDGNGKIIATSGGDAYASEANVIRAMHNVVHEMKKFK